jgi:hypothetical protein
MRTGWSSDASSDLAVFSRAGGLLLELPQASSIGAQVTLLMDLTT